MIDFLKDILDLDLLTLEKKAAQYFKGNFINYPFSFTDIIRSFNPLFLLKITCEVAIARFNKILNTTSDYSFKEWVETRYGETLYNSYFGPYSQKVWGIDPDALDARTASDRISFNSIFDYAIKAFTYFFLEKDDFSSIHSPLKKGFYYSKGGIVTLSEKLSEECKKLGVNFNYKYNLKNIKLNNGRVIHISFENGHKLSEFDYCISTIPLTKLISALGLAEQLLPIRFRSIIFVFLEVPKKNVSPYSWIYFPDQDISFQRITDFSQIHNTMVPPDSSGLCAEISCFKEDPIWSFPDDVIVKRVRDDLDRVGIVSNSVQCVAHVVRKEFGYPVQVSGFLEITKTLLSPIQAINNLATVGRQGLYKYCNMNECVEMAFSLSDKIDNNENNFMKYLKPRWKGAGLEKERI